MRRLPIISIHAPSRERRMGSAFLTALLVFQSTLPRGSDRFLVVVPAPASISIHAPSRERHKANQLWYDMSIFQSTLPRGSDDYCCKEAYESFIISIHAPSRERPEKFVL